MRIEFYYLPKSINLDFLKKVIGIVLREEKKIDSEINVIFLSKRQIEKLNFNYRKKQESTDVLSFKADNQFSTEDRNYLGELVVCFPYIKDNAKQFEQSLKKELASVLIHGVLHLLGYNHEIRGKDSKIMMAKQEKYLLII
ncbi:MAG: rRNA maturation RNase YbeY [Parcubacteria group bacterium CG_4_10_14_0_2_um_filter_7_35_8]|nr:MAG: rRNA maturation RNase YbeY [Parcubacteria group bacterium CG10_big_fil_rev_8_21_14_0_10_35_15]PIZ77304.1 MAG: rRNA maturation RNase YbeY [Parcubacteria group bacterium CG_4_10_14_0_2_um_filter_7_35_8]